MRTDAIAAAARPPMPAMNPASARSRTDFASILGVADRGGLRVDDSPRSVAESFVAAVLVEPVLASAREANTQPAPFGPAPGENAFGALLDSQRALELVRKSRWPIVERLASDLERGNRAPA
jgi:hypothetical protein